MLVGLAALATVLVLQFFDPAPLERARMQVFDIYQNAAPRDLPGASNTVIVDIDEESIERLGQWPWPRSELAELTRRLGEAGASAVVFDIVFSEPDRTSPAQIARRYSEMGEGGVLPGAFMALPDNDAVLAASFAQVPVVTGFFLDREERGRAIEPKASFTIHGSLPSRHVANYAGSLQPIPALEEAAKGNGFVSRESDSDGIVRRAPLVAIKDGALLPALSLEAVRVAQGGGSPNLLASDGSGETIEAAGAAVAVRLGGVEIPVTEAGEMWVHFPPPQHQTAIPAWPIIRGEMAGADLERAVDGKIVFVGGSAAGLQDLVATPLSDLAAGVTVHAAAAEQIMAGHFLERPDWAYGLELVAALVLGGLMALLLPRLGAAAGVMLAGAGIVIVIAISWLAFTRAQYLLDPIYPVLAISAVYVIQTVAIFYREERQRSYIHSAFDRYLSPEIVRQIASDPGKLELGGEERDMSVMMCDIRGFSRISERLSPREVINFLIAFLTPMSDILLARKATLDKYIGDAILAFWNAPLDDPDHHANAARAALEMIERTRALNETMSGKHDAVWPGEVSIGIGLNSGTCCVGNMGSEQRLAYSLIGDTVNVASRLEGLTKLYGVPIIAGAELAGHLPGFALLEIDRVRVVGRDTPETIYAILGDEAVGASERFSQLAASHQSLLAAYRDQEWDAAQQSAAGAQELYLEFGIPGLGDLYAQRIADLRAKPPGTGWDGVYAATEK